MELLLKAFTYTVVKTENRFEGLKKKFQFCIFALVLPAMDGEKPNIFLYIL